MSARDRWIERHLRRLHLGQFLQRAGELLAGFLLAFGTAVLLVKLLVPGLWPHVLWLGLGAVPVLVAALWQSRRGQFTRTESVALLDRTLAAGGLLMTLTETADGEWESHLPQMDRLWRDSLPRVRPKRFASYVALPLLFAAGVCFVPLRQSAATPVQPRTVAQQATQQLEEMLKLVEEANVLEEEQQQELREEIAKLAEETKHTPLTHEKWETVDALEQKMRLKLQESAMVADKASAAALTLAMAENGEVSLSAARVEQLEQELLEALQQMQKSGSLSGASPSLQAQLQKLMQNGQFKQLSESGAERQQMLDELKELLDREQKKLSEARKKCNGGKCPNCGKESCEGEGQCEGDGQCRQCGGPCQGGQCASCLGDGPDGDGNPGRGGVNRGRGDAAMSWGDESDRQGVKFKETVLPPGFKDAPKEDVQGVTLNAPEVNPAASAPRAAGRETDAATGKETWNRKLRPRHREVVREFFGEK